MQYLPKISTAEFPLTLTSSEHGVSPKMVERSTTDLIVTLWKAKEAGQRPIMLLLIA